MSDLLVSRRRLRKRVARLLRLAPTGGPHRGRGILTVQQDGFAQCPRAVVMEPRPRVAHTPEFGRQKVVGRNRTGWPSCLRVSRSAPIDSLVPAGSASSRPIACRLRSP